MNPLIVTIGENNEEDRYIWLDTVSSCGEEWAIISDQSGKISLTLLLNIRILDINKLLRDSR
jgi:hypothetical protein